MQVQINTDKNIEGTDDLTSSATETIKRHLDRFSDQITRVEAYLSDENSARKTGSADMRCLLEVRISGRDPMTVTENADAVDKAVNGAAQKMVRALETTLGKLNKR